MSTKNIKIIISGGGTGGHIYPGLSIAQEFLNCNSENKILFVGTKTGLESKIVPQKGFEFKTINVCGLKGKFSLKNILVLAKLPWAIIQSYKILKKFKPDLVIGVGGYVSGPLIFTASLLGIPAVIHEQNFIFGLTNRNLIPFVDKVFISFPETGEKLSKDKINKVELTGNPVRLPTTKQCPVEEKAVFAILIFGGSRGSHRINTAVIEALPSLLLIKDKLEIIHQTGDEDYQMVKNSYTENGFKAEVKPFIDKMSDAYQRADLVICRSGATTIAELTAYGKASVLIPYPYAAAKHQEKNARVLVNKGAARIILDHEITGEKLVEIIKELINDRKKLKDMEKKSRQLGVIDASQKIVKSCYELEDNRTN